MEHTRMITSITSKIRIPEAVLEEIVNHRTRRMNNACPETGIEKQLDRRHFNIVSTYSVQTAIKGMLELECYNNRSAVIELINVPLMASFLVTCMKEKMRHYKLEFTASLN